MANDDLARRISTLRTLCIVAIFLALVTPVAVAYGAIRYVKSITPKLSVEVRSIRAQDITVLNEGRKSRGTLRARGDNVELALGAATGARVVVRARSDGATLRLRDTARHHAEIAVTGAGPAFRSGLRIQGGETEGRLEVSETDAGLALAHRTEQKVDLEAQLDVTKLAGTTLQLRTLDVEARPREAELTVPAAEVRAPTSLRLEHRGSTLRARVGGVPHLDLRLGGGEIWSSPVPPPRRGVPTPEELEPIEAPPAAPEPPAPAPQTAAPPPPPP